MRLLIIINNHEFKMGFGKGLCCGGVELGLRLRQASYPRLPTQVQCKLQSERILSRVRL
jgi:hypothetical protein